MMDTATYTKSGNKSTVSTKLDKSIFSVETKNHDLLKRAYLAYLANGRVNLAVTKKRGQVSGGGRKPHPQKGTGRARSGSSRNPIWRGGGITFGPTGNENYSVKINLASKRLALKQALSMAAKESKIKIIETFECKEGLIKPTLALLNKIGVEGNVLLVVSQKDDLVERATRNVPNLKVVSSNYLSVYDVLNADYIVISQKSLPVISAWLQTEKK